MKAILITCVILFLALNLSIDLVPLLGLSLVSFRPWQLLTSVFCHIDIWHCVFNCFAIWMFGSTLQDVWGDKKFAVFFIGTSVVANILWILSLTLYAKTPFYISLGASGGIYALLYTYAYFWPNAIIFAFFLFPVKARNFVIFFGAVELLFGITKSGAGVNHTVHLAGLLAAAVWLDYTCNGRGITWLRSKYQNLVFWKKTRHLTVIKGGLKEPSNDDNDGKKNFTIN